MGMAYGLERLVLLQRWGNTPSEMAQLPSDLAGFANRISDELVFEKDVNEVNDYALRWGFEEACTRAEIVVGETVPGGIIWHDLRRTFATRLRANGVHEYDISGLLGHSRPGLTQVYARATRTVLEQAVEKLTEPWGQGNRIRKKSGINLVPHLSLISPRLAPMRSKRGTMQFVVVG